MLEEWKAGCHEVCNTICNKYVGIPHEKWKICNLVLVMYCAAGEGRIEDVKACRQLGVDNFDKGMFLAAEKGHIEIVKLFKEWGANEFDTAMFNAARGGHTDIVKLCKDWEQRNST